MPHYPKEIEYSEKYYDDYYEYRHVILPKEIFKKIEERRTLKEDEWRALGIQQSRGWVHYAIYSPEPHILLFRRPRRTNPETGEVDEKTKKKKESYDMEKKNNLDIEYC